MKSFPRDYELNDSTYLSIDQSCDIITSFPHDKTDLILTLNDTFTNELPQFPTGLTRLIIMAKGLTTLPRLPDSLVKLTLLIPELSVVPRFPDGLEILDIIYTKAPLTQLPTGLTHLLCSGNQLTELPPLPNGLLRLDCSNNKLTELPPLPRSLVYLSSQDNNFRKLAYVQIVDFFHSKDIQDVQSDLVEDGENWHQSQADELEWAQSRLNEINSDLKHLSRVKNSASDKAADPLDSNVGEFLGNDSIESRPKGGTKRRKRRRTKRKKNKRTTRKR